MTGYDPRATADARVSRATDGKARAMADAKMEKEARLKAALRENLRKRKAQERETRDDSDKPEA